MGSCLRASLAKDVKGIRDSTSPDLVGMLLIFPFTTEEPFLLFLFFVLCVAPRVFVCLKIS